MGMRICPKCFNDTLNLAIHGTVDVLVNNKKLSTGRLLYNLEKDSAERFEEELLKKLEEHFEWYGRFQNKGPIKSIEVCSANFACQNKCKIDLNYRFTVIDLLIKEERFNEIINNLAKKYSIPMEME
jgi:hypothetical protein